MTMILRPQALLLLIRLMRFHSDVAVLFLPCHCLMISLLKRDTKCDNVIHLSDEICRRRDRSILYD